MSVNNLNKSSNEKIKLLINTIGFKNIGIDYYEYKLYQIDLHNTFYNFHDGYKWTGHYCNDLKPFENYFKKKLRSIKLKQLLK